MTLALDKLPTPICDRERGEVTSEESGCAFDAINVETGMMLEQRLSYAVGLLERLRPFSVGPHYADEYGNEIPPDLDTSPALLADLDAFLALLRQP